MAISATDFWEIGSSNFPPLTDETMSLAENELGVRLPTELIELLKLQNGGYTKGFAFPTTCATSWATDHVPLHELFGIVVAKLVVPDSNIMQSNYLIEEWGMPEKQVLLCCDGHLFITLDNRKGPHPSVAWIDTEMDVDVQLAESFATFLAGLVPEDTFNAE